MAGSSQNFDAVTVEVVRHKLEGIANEMEATLIRSAFSTIVKEAMDASAGLFTARGETLAQAIAIPMHLSSVVPMVQKLLETFPLATMKEGDAFIMNDPYSGGTHIPDIAVVTPVYFKGRAIAISAALTHHQDVGGMSPGSTPTNATEIYQEGIRLPPLKLRDAGVENDAIIQILRLNSRVPDVFVGDLNAQLAACTIGARRLADLAEVYGHNQLTAIFEDLLSRSEMMTRAALKQIPEGTYRYVDHMDNDGVVLDERVRIEVAVTIKGGNMTCDFQGTSPQVKGPFNLVPSGSYAAACFALRAVTDSSIPTNEGCFRPISLRLPEGSILNPTEPAAVGCRALTAKRVTGAILGALRQAVPEKVPADSAAELVTIRFGGKRSDGKMFVTTQHIVSGSGASRQFDGVDVIQTDLTNGMNVPAESMEMDVPIRIHRMALMLDSGGPGAHRGGLGASHEYEILDGDVTITYRAERHYVPAEGAEGGQPGGLARAVIRRVNGAEEVIPSKQVVVLHKGDRLIVETAGGGGFGPPESRERDAISADVRNGKVSQAAASRVYGHAAE